MHPLVFFAIDSQDRARRDREDRVIWRNQRAAHASKAAVERDSRWARAVARIAAKPAKDCDGVVA
jgi:hypothetical protein